MTAARREPTTGAFRPVAPERLGAVLAEHVLGVPTPSGLAPGAGPVVPSSGTVPAVPSSRAGPAAPPSRAGLAVPSSGAGPVVPFSGTVRVAVDGHPAADPAAVADALVEPLRVAGRPVLRVGSGWFLRPASVRLERGRHDPDAYYDDRLDIAALRRELLDPLGPGGTGRYLPTLWDPGTDRATRAAYEAAPPGAVLVLDGTLLLGLGLPFDLSIHLRLSAGARGRRTGPDARWTLPAYDRYEQEVDPEAVADVVVRMDDPRHPALRSR